jgi:hypothetical protein
MYHEFPDKNVRLTTHPLASIRTMTGPVLLVQWYRCIRTHLSHLMVVPETACQERS